MRMKRIGLWIASFVFVVVSAVSIGSFFPQDTALMVGGDCGTSNNSDQTCTCTPPQTKTAVPFGSGTRSGNYFKCTTPATAAPGTTTPAAGAAAAAGSGTITDPNADQSVSCAVEKIGWIVCPVIESAAKISDKAFEILGDNFLRVDPELVKDDSGTKVGWEVARNLANIMFIIAFLIIIMSQVTGRGLNNYGIKKMLPRLIIAAIAVNVSYYICQLAVDLTNILGYEIQNALAQIANTVGPSVFGSVANYSDTEQATSAVFQDGALMTVIVTGALAAGTVVFFMLPTIIALVPLILITVMTIIIILLLRKALIVLLIVISPIAFVLYLLPNTEKYFSKWMSMFGKLLMVFPIVGMLFGAGQLASTIILVAGSDGNQALAAMQCNPDDAAAKKAFNASKSAGNGSLCGEKPFIVKGGKNGNNTCFSASDKCGVNNQKTASWTLGLVAMGVAVAPLLAVWSVLQGALSAAGAIGGKLTTAVSKGVGGAGKPLKGAGDALGKRMKENQTGVWQRAQARGLDPENLNKKGYERIAGGFAARKGNRAFRQNATKHALETATNHAVQGNMENLLGGLTASEQKRATRSIQAQEEQHKSEEIKNAEIDINSVAKGDMDGIKTALLEANRDGDEAKAKAAQNLLFGMGGAGVDAFVDAMKNKSGKVADALAENTRLKHGNIKGTHAGLNEWANNGGGATIEQAMARPQAYSNLSADNIAGQTPESLRAINAALQAATSTYNDTSQTVDVRNQALAQAQGIKKASEAALLSKSIEGAKVGNKAMINDMANHTF
ncbi:MAG: rane protein of unknown function [Candidatus Saccharibacteria bacterium]|nr:rane protein of unknown function [Candidatus Saccharibacteria bacterium]